VQPAEIPKDLYWRLTKPVNHRASRSRKRQKIKKSELLEPSKENEMKLLGQILATGLLALEDATQAFSNPTANTAAAVENFIQGVFAIWDTTTSPAAASAKVADRGK